MIFNNVDPTDMGAGVVLFKNAIDFDWHYIYNMSIDLIDQEYKEMYTLTSDPETKEEIYLNRTGYLFPKDSINIVPKRASRIHQNKNLDIRTVFNFIENCKDKYLLKYFEKYPLAYNCVWWKVKGHLICYGPGGRLGPHSDQSLDYVYGVHKTKLELGVRSTVTCLVYLNSSVENQQDDELGYTGGNHHFNYLNITHKPVRGDIIMFPSNYVAAHEVLPIHSGLRLSYLGWYSHGTPNLSVGEDVCDPILRPDIADDSNNIYLTSLREDYRKYLIEQGYRTDSDQYRVTNIN